MTSSHYINRINIILLTCCVITFLINFTSYNLMVIGGDKLQRTNQQITDLSLENQLLQERISEAQSLDLAQNQADHYGFIAISKTVSLPAAVPVAYNLQSDW